MNTELRPLALAWCFFCFALLAKGELTLEDGAITRGPATSKQMALVFTAHTFAESADSILDELQRHHAKASLFLTGDFLAKASFASIIQRAIRDGHYVGPHSDKHLLYCSWEHPPKMLITKAAFEADLQENLRKLESFGIRRGSLRYFLPPYEHYNAQVAAWTKQAGLMLLNYTPGTRSNADYTGESDTNFVSSEKIFQSIVQKEKTDPAGLNGFILLLHLGAGPGRQDKFASRLSELLDYLGARGYTFVRVDSLLEPTLFIRANQVGFTSKQPKSALAFGAESLPKTFTLVDLASGKVAFNGPVRAIDSTPWGRWSNHVELDFSRFEQNGHYAIEYAGNRSLPFRIGARALKELPDVLLEFMRQQRCGYNPWLDTVCHPFDGRTAFGPRTNGSYVNATGGWHDAADLLKYLLTSGNATAQMLLAYDLSRPPGSSGRPASTQENLEDKVNALGQPYPNGVPDILDEARWGLEWMLKLHPSRNELYHQIADDRDHIGRRLPQDEVADYGWGKGSYRIAYCADGKPQGLQEYKSQSTGLANLAGRYAAAMALAYQIWKDAPAERVFAERSLQAGREVYEMGRKQEGVQQGNSYKAPYRYEETTWADDMEWGAAELFRATGEKHYLTESVYYAELAADESWMGKEQTGHYQYYPFMNLGHFRLYPLADRGMKNRLAGFYRAGIERCAAAGTKNPYGTGVPFIWCSNNLLTALATQCLLYERMTGDHQFARFAQKQIDWLLGRNPWGYTMFTGVGSVSPKDTHLMTVQLTKRQVRGGLVDGPVYERIFKSLKGVAITEPDPLADFQGPAVYHDDVQDYSTDEPTMDGTASAILLFSLL